MNFKTPLLGAMTGAAIGSLFAGFAMTYLFSLKKNQYDGSEEANVMSEQILADVCENFMVAVVDGKSIVIEEVKDGVFSEKIMGEGVAFLPEGKPCTHHFKRYGFAIIEQNPNSLSISVICKLRRLV